MYRDGAAYRDRDAILGGVGRTCTANFGARRGEFRLVELPGERVQTQLIGSTWYEIDIGPEWYWRIYADGIVSAIHRRVLKHIKQLSQNKS